MSFLNDVLVGGLAVTPEPYMVIKKHAHPYGHRHIDDKLNDI